jgi:hypothetical protein
MRNSIKLVLLFVFIFAPPVRILPFGPDKLIAVYSLLALATWHRDKFSTLLGQVNVKLAFSCYFLLVLVTACIDIVMSHNLIGSYQSTLMLIEILPCALFFTIEFATPDQGSNQFLKALVTIAIVQSAIALVLFIYPSYNQELKHSILRFEDTDTVVLLQHRAFGFTAFYTYGMPLFIGFVGAVVIHLSITRRMWFILCLPLLLFAIAVNARIGFLPIVVYLCLAPIFVLTARNRLKFLLIIGLLALMVLSIWQIDIEDYRHSNYYWTLKWLKDGYLEVMGGQENTTLNALGEMIQVPPPRNWLFGTGTNLFDHPDVTRASDIGYVLQFYYGGFVYVLLLWSPLLYTLMAGIRRTRDRSMRVLLVSFLISIVIVNVKGDFFDNNDAFRGMTVCAFVLLNSRDVVNGAGLRRKVESTFARRTLRPTVTNGR